MQKNGITNFGAALTELREEKGFTLEQLAESATITLDELRDYETGIKRPSIGTIIDISMSLKVSPFELPNRALDKSKYFQKAA